MPNPGSERPESFQAAFHRRWDHLNDQHVRALAWLLSAPDLLDLGAPQWGGRIATLDPDETLDGWLAALDRMPGELHANLNLQPFMRLGLYAEKLMAFYFRHRGVLAAHGLQVRGSGGTIGEFDFLLHDAGGLRHLEFATKFYLCLPGSATDVNRFVGPNLADTLGRKLRKILDRQLLLAAHPAAQDVLPQQVTIAQALIKGWLFYRDADVPQDAGLSPEHCRGFWCTQSEFSEFQAEYCWLPPRLAWLAPAKVSMEQTLDHASAVARLDEYFSRDTAPVMAALLEQRNGYAVETSRGFVTPDDWPARAEQAF